MWQFHFNYEDLTVLDLKDTEFEKIADGSQIIRRKYFDENQILIEGTHNSHIFSGGGASTNIFRLARKLMKDR